MAPILRKTLNTIGAITPPANPSRRSSNSTSFSLNSLPNNFSANNALKSLPNSVFPLGVRGMGRLRLGFPVKGFGFAPIEAVSDGGDGGFGGWDGNTGSGGGGGGGGEDESGGNGGSLFSWYSTALDQHPVLTKSITSAILNLLGDLICQVLIEQAPKLNVKRAFIFTFLGLVLVGPTLHFWYLALSHLVTMDGASGAFLRLLLDQFVFSPIFIGVFLSTLATLEGRPSEIVPKLKQEWFSSVVANWQLWIPFQFLNFRFVPQQFQVLVANIVALAWNVIFSFKAHREVVLK